VTVPPDRRNRPTRAGGAARGDDGATTTTETSLTDATDYVAQLRTRRAVAWRSPVLEHGTGDPLDALAREPMPDIPRNVLAARRAWLHLADLGYLGDPDDRATREWWLRTLGVAA